MKIELKSGEVLEGKVLSRALSAMVVKSDGKYFLISRYALKDPKLFKFPVDKAVDSEDV